MKVLSFWLDDELFGIELSYVKEINRNIEYTSVPKAPRNIVGLFNMRGQIVTLFNLADILGYGINIREGKTTCIILRNTGDSANQMGFVIDKSGDVIEVEEDMCELLPANMDENEAKYIKTVVRLKNELLRIIEPDSVFGNN